MCHRVVILVITRCRYFVVATHNLKDMRNRLIGLAIGIRLLARIFTAVQIGVDALVAEHCLTSNH